ncbi:MAG: DUF4199 domain-containing protein [Nonlabens sp.]
MDSVVKKIGLLFGIVGGASFVVNYLIIWQNEIFGNALYGTILRLLPLLFGIAAQITSKIKLKNIITFKQAVIPFVICTAIMLLAELIMNYLIYVQIDPGAQEKIAELYLKNKELMEAQGVKTMDSMTRTISLKSLSSVAALNFLIYMIPGLIVAFVMRKKPAHTA